MGTSLIPVADDARVSVASMSALHTGKEYLPSIRFMTGKCKKVARGEAEANTYYFCRSSNSSEKIGKSFSAVVVAAAIKGMRVNQKPPLSVYPKDLDENGYPTDQEFLDIVEDSNIENSGALFGYEVLMWLPAIQEFGLFFLSGASTRKLFVETVSKVMSEHTIWSSKTIETDYTWVTPEVTVSPDTSIALPTEKQYQEALRIFNLTKEGGAEAVELEEGTTTRSR